MPNPCYPIFPLLTAARPGGATHAVRHAANARLHLAAHPAGAGHPPAHVSAHHVPARAAAAHHAPVSAPPTAYDCSRAPGALPPGPGMVGNPVGAALGTGAGGAAGAGSAAKAALFAGALGLASVGGIGGYVGFGGGAASAPAVAVSSASGSDTGVMTSPGQRTDSGGPFDIGTPGSAPMPRPGGAPPIDLGPLTPMTAPLSGPALAPLPIGPLAGTPPGSPILDAAGPVDDQTPAIPGNGPPRAPADQSITGIGDTADVPEPGSLWLLSSGLVLAAARRR